MRNSQYACRKTLAERRPRVRGRFAKNEESGEPARPSSSHVEYDDDEQVNSIIPFLANYEKNFFTNEI